jgi:hypothetical protein
MVAKLKPTPGTEVDVVDLTAMSQEELRAELVACTAEIDHIKEQLQDQQRRIDLGDGYQAWYRRARWALVHRKNEKREIGLLISQHQSEATAARLAEHARRTRDMQERRAAALAAIEDRGNTDGLLLRLKVVLQHLIGDGNEIPDALTDSDQDALHDLSVYLRAKFTSEGVRDARRRIEQNGGAS